ncbi:MAG: hypothetical protein L0215_04735 [Gemmataceae bacterium]|nr:hypothetical protein [Gemmataceae bacterium]
MNEKRAKEALKIAKKLAKAAKSATDFHNAFFGVGGKFGELSPERAEREAFLKTRQYQEIFQIRAELEKSCKVAS